MEIEDRKIPVSITLTLKHIHLMEQAIEKSGEVINYSKYIRGLIEGTDIKNKIDKACVWYQEQLEAGGEVTPMALDLKIKEFMGVD